MQLKRIKIGSFETDNNVFLAPLAGFSDFAMRKICSDYGAGLTFTEMVSCKGILYDNENTKILLKKTDGEKISCAQIFGNDPDIMLEAIKRPPLCDFDVIDINFGCPMPKIYQNGEGSALLKNPSIAEKIVAECKKSGKPITCKMRIGLTENSINGLEFATALENGGADMITVHGRTREKIYAGDIHGEEIAKIVAKVKIPVIANGGIFTKEDADKVMTETGADGVMLARGALEKPWLFAEILNNPYSADKKDLIFRHIDLLKTVYDDRTVAVTFRKQLCLYLKGEKNSAELKQKVLTLNSTDEIKRELTGFFG
ncbi:tRNA-dihydrouridine synthase [Acidiphilium sp. CAG:727]|nr:tRNA-dihydrouridine synthase [Acidiphilium sp. CAG:727]